MRFLVTFLCLAVLATVALAQPVEVEADQQQLSEANAEALLAADSETGHENESERLARQFGYGRGYGGGYGRGYGGYGGYGRGGFGYGGFGRGYGGYGGYGRYRGGYYG